MTLELYLFRTFFGKEVFQQQNSTEKFCIRETLGPLIRVSFRSTGVHVYTMSLCQYHVSLRRRLLMMILTFGIMEKPGNIAMTLQSDDPVVFTMIL